MSSQNIADALLAVHQMARKLGLTASEYERAIDEAQLAITTGDPADSDRFDNRRRVEVVL